jgi:hypothetical protein
MIFAYFSPIFPPIVLTFTLGSFLKITKEAHTFGALFSTIKAYALILTMAIFSPTHLVPLLSSSHL